jgi:hypothetical protein
MGDRLTDDELNFLADRFPPGPKATLLLKHAGFAAANLPSAAGLTAGEFWFLINDEIEADAIEYGRERILTAAGRSYRASRIAIPPPPKVWRVLFVGASPRGTSQIRADQELRAIREAPVEVRYCAGATVADLAQVRTARPHILHLACHGQGATLLFEDGIGEPFTLHAQDQAETLRMYHQQAIVRLHGVVLNACTSVKAASLLSRQAEVVVAHRDELSNDAAVEFARAMYRVLTDGRWPDRVQLAAAPQLAAQELVKEARVDRSLLDGLVVFDRGRMAFDGSA